MSQDREYELKFAIAAADVSSLLAHPVVEGASHRVSKLAATYFDTPGGHLRRRGLSLRIRDADGAKTQTLKQTGASFIDRGEWSHETDRDVPDLGRLRRTPPGRGFLTRRIEKSLGAVFTVKVKRTTFMLTAENTRIEAAIDRGEIVVRGRRLPVCEFELELKSGDPAGLFDMARSLIATVPLTPSLVSKSERGYRLSEGIWGEPVNNPPVEVGADMTPIAAFRTVLEACLHDIMLNISALAETDGIEAVHRTRIGVRRLRAAIALFKPHLRGEMFDRLRREMKWISGRLGAARDLDVLQSETFDPAARHDAVSGGEALASRMRARKDAAHNALHEALGSQRWRVLLLDLLAWRANAAEAGDMRDEKTSLVDFAGARLKRRRKSILKMGAELSQLTPTGHHRLRLRAKKLRYALEFFEKTRGLGRGSKIYRKLVQDLEALQSALGKLHDHEARRHILHDAIMAWDVSADIDHRGAIFAAGALSVLPIEAEDLIGRAEAAHRRIRKHQPF